MKIYILTIITALLISSASIAMPPPQCNDGSVSRAQQNTTNKNNDGNSLMGCGGSGSGNWGGNNYIGRYHVRTTAPGPYITYLRIATGTTLQQCQSDLNAKMSEDTSSAVFEIFGSIEYCHYNF